MAQIIRFSIDQQTGSFVYPDTGLPPVTTERTADSTAEAAAIASDREIVDDSACDPLVVDSIADNVQRMRDTLLRAWPSCEPMDTHTIFFKDGRRISIVSFRERLLHDLQKAVSWQIGHADESMSVAGDELVSAYRESDGTEIAIERIDQAETRVRQAEARRRLWREVSEGVERPWTYPIIGTHSATECRDRIKDALGWLYNLCGEPSKTFVAHRLVWAIARMAERAMSNCTTRWNATTNAHARRMIEAQDRAMQMLHELAVAAYQTGTGDSYRSHTVAATHVLASTHHATADWLQGRQVQRSERKPDRRPGLSQRLRRLVAL